MTILNNINITGIVFQEMPYDIVLNILGRLENHSLTYIVIILSLLTVLHLVLLIVSAGISSLTERKIFAAAQRRQGPAVVGFGGILQFLADGIKLLLKEVITPYPSTFGTFLLAPVIVFVTAMLGWSFIPTDFGHVFVDLELNVLWLFTFSSLGVYGLILAGWSSNSKYSFLGGLRSAAQMVSYEVSLGFIIICVALVSGSYNFTKIVLAQYEVWNFLALWPLAVAFYVSILAETNRAPFDLPEAEAELVAGYNLEYSAIPFALFFLGEYSSMLLMSGIFIMFFFGGWFLIPNFLKVVFKYIIALFSWGLDSFIQYFYQLSGFLGVFLTSVVKVCFSFLNFLATILFGFILGTGSFIFALKMVFSLIIFILIRASYPRYRYDHLMNVGWKIFLPLTLGYLLFIAGILKIFGGLPDMGTESGVEQEYLAYGLSKNWENSHTSLTTLLKESALSLMPVAYADIKMPEETRSSRSIFEEFFAAYLSTGRIGQYADGELIENINYPWWHKISVFDTGKTHVYFDWDGYLKEQQLREMFNLLEKQGEYDPENPKKGDMGYPTKAQMVAQAVEETDKYLRRNDLYNPMAFHIIPGMEQAQNVNPGAPDFGYDLTKPGIHTTDRILNMLFAVRDDNHPVASQIAGLLYAREGNVHYLSDRFRLTDSLEQKLRRFARVFYLQQLISQLRYKQEGVFDYSHQFEIDGCFQAYVKELFGDWWPEGKPIPSIRDIRCRRDASSLAMHRILINLLQAMRMDDYESCHHQFFLHFAILDFFFTELKITWVTGVLLDNPLNQRGPLPGPQVYNTNVMNNEFYYAVTIPEDFF